LKQKTKTSRSIDKNVERSYDLQWKLLQQGWEEKKQSQRTQKKFTNKHNNGVVICLFTRQVFLVVFLKRLGTSNTENKRIIILMVTKIFTSFKHKKV
jgi:hypothetical protein